jgi:hypothetical protein
MVLIGQVETSVEDNADWLSSDVGRKDPLIG